MTHTRCRASTPRCAACSPLCSGHILCHQHRGKSQLNPVPHPRGFQCLAPDSSPVVCSAVSSLSSQGCRLAGVQAGSAPCHSGQCVWGGHQPSPGQGGCRAHWPGAHHSPLPCPQNCSATKGNFLRSSGPHPDSIDWRKKGNFVTPVKNQVRSV